MFRSTTKVSSNFNFIFTFQSNISLHFVYLETYWKDIDKILKIRDIMAKENVRAFEMITAKLTQLETLCEIWFEKNNLIYILVYEASMKINQKKTHR